MELLTYGIPVWFVLLCAVLYAVFSAYVNSLPLPGPNATPKQVQWFQFLHLLNMNFQRMGAAVRVPGTETQAVAAKKDCE